MTKVLYANGCSFTAGSELEQELPVTKRSPVAVSERRLERSWPRQLATKLGIPTVVNEARGGGSNARALRMTFAFVAGHLSSGGRPTQLLVTLGVTDLVRAETCRELVAGEEEWVLLKPNLIRERQASRAHRRLNKLYYRHLFSREQAVKRHLQDVVGLQAFLRNAGVPHHLHEAMPNNAPLLDDVGRTPVAHMLDERQYLGLERRGTALTWDPTRSFEAWAVRTGLPLGSGGHPLAEGHAAWAELLAADLDRSPDGR